MKRIVILALSLTILAGNAWGQWTSVKESASKYKTMCRLVDGWKKQKSTSYWIHDDRALHTHYSVAQPYLGNPSDSLKNISDGIDITIKNAPDHLMNKERYYEYKMILGAYLMRHPKEAVEVNCLLGDLLRYIPTKESRNFERATEYYHMALDEVPITNKRLRGALNVRMGMSRALDKSATNEFTHTIRQFYLATKEDPYYASMLGKCFMMGLGVYQDMGLALALMDLGSMSGDNDSYIYQNFIQYMLEHPARSAQAQLSEEKFLMFLTLSHISNDHENALRELFSAAEDNYALAFYQMGRIYDNLLSDDLSEADQNFIKREIFTNYRKAAEAQFAPALYDLAQFCLTYTYDTEKGDVFIKDKKGNYREKDIKEVRNQAIKMIEDAAEKRYEKAYEFLGDLYSKGGEYGVPARDIEKALRYHLMAARRGIKSSQTKMNGIMSTGMIKKERIIEIVKETEEDVMMQDMSRASIGKMAFDNSRNVKFKRALFSFYRESMYLPESINEPDPLLTDILERCYHLAYEKYVVMLSDEIAQKEGNNEIDLDGPIMYLRVRMKDLRESYNLRGIGKAITQSVYEDLD